MIKLELKFPDLGEKFKKHRGDIMLALAASMQTNRAMMFDKDGADNGKAKWDPPKLRAGRPLQLSGALRNSMGPRNDGIKPGYAKGSVLRMFSDTVEIGSSLAYAAMMNDGTVNMPGGVLRPKQAQALKIPLEGGKFMFRKSVKIPARKMNEITPDDEREWTETLSNLMAEILSQGE